MTVDGFRKIQGLWKSTQGEIIMGGYGSGRWGVEKPDRKIAVEDCWLILDVRWLVEAGVIRPNADHRGRWEFRYRAKDEEPPAEVGFAVRTGTDSGILRLRYAIVKRTGGEEKARERVELIVKLVTSGLPSAGRRWWFICPARRVDRADHGSRRVEKLYLPWAGARLFACRRCYDLTYESCRKSRSDQALWNSVAAGTGVSGTMAKANFYRACSRRRMRREHAFSRAVFYDQAEATPALSGGGEPRHAQAT